MPLTGPGECAGLHTQCFFCVLVCGVEAGGPFEPFFSQCQSSGLVGHAEFLRIDAEFLRMDTEFLRMDTEFLRMDAEFLRMDAEFLRIEVEGMCCEDRVKFHSGQGERSRCALTPNPRYSLQPAVPQRLRT